MRRNSSRLGRWGEDLVARFLGYKRQPFSGGDWPHKEDLLKVDGQDRELAQVKTTSTDDQTGFLKQWLELAKNARADRAQPVWFEVYKTDWEAYIFEKRLIRKVKLGVGGEGGVT